MHPTLEKFYLSVLGYAGLELRDGVMVNVSDKIGDMKIDGKFLTLPYHDNLRKPEGRHIFHPLNESYTVPETSFLAMYKKRLVLELNMKLSALMISLLNVCADIQLQQKTKSPKLVSIISAIGETDMTTVENFVSMVKHSQKVNEEAFLFDIFVKKNGQISDVPFSAIGKVNFVLYTELHRSLEDKADGYKVFGGKMRKKDLHSVINVFDALFNLPDATEDTYTVGTDHKPFRYFNAIMLTSYQVANRVNEVAKLLASLKEPLLGADDMLSDLGWTEVIEDVYGLTDEIRMIPNQSNSAVETGKLKVREPKQVESNTQVPVPSMTRQPPQAQQPSFTPPSAQQQAPQTQHLNTQSQAPLTAEDIIRGAVNQQQQMMRQYQMSPQQALMAQQPQMYQQPMMQQQQPMYPQQMQQPMMMPQQPQMYQQPMMMQQQQPLYPQQMQQPMMMPQVYQQPMAPNPFNQGQQQPAPQGIMLNPFLV